MSDQRYSPPGGQLFLFGPHAADEPDPLLSQTAAGVAVVDGDAAARAFAVDPSHHVVLEASAGTGKTSVLVARYINLLKANVDPANILAITFTRKAAAEMRERIVRELRDVAARSELDKARWTDLRDRLGDIAISTIDAFCLSLLREFPLEADLDPGFEMADETEVPRLVDEALDRSLRIFADLAKSDPDVALVLAQLGVARARAGLCALLERRLVAWDALNRFLADGPRELTADNVCRRTAMALQNVFRAVPGGLARFLADGPVEHPRYQVLQRDLRRLPGLESAGDAGIRVVLDRVAAHFLTADGKARRSGSTIHPYRADHYPAPEAAKRHRVAVFQMAPHIERVVSEFTRDLNVVLARGVRRMFAIALEQYRRALEERSVLDFPDVLQRALDLLRRMDEFSQSRYRLESRYHHVLIDEFQDTSRAQWELVSLLIQSWGEGLGLATSPSLFVVGDRKQSIYRFRDAEVAVLEDAGRHIAALRPGSNPRRSISRSFRAVPELLAFVNELFAEIAQPTNRPDDFRYDESDRFPVDPSDARGGPALGISAAEEPAACAAALAAEIERLLQDGSVRDRVTGVPRKARPGDIAILFRSRASHREFERELEARGVPTYVYKGLGFFDADEIKDLSALMRYLAHPESDLRAAAFLRSRFVRLSDRGLAVLAPRLAAALTAAEPPDGSEQLDPEDQRVLAHVRRQVSLWLPVVDRIPPADLIEQLLPETAYALELRGSRRQQAWENVKKMRALVRRIQNRGYATLARIADHIDALSSGDEANATLEALDAVNLMTVHASKGLEFPVVFVVNMAKGASGPPRPIRVLADGPDGQPSVSVGPFVSEMDEAEREREKQETRRLLYVALTRARDRLYLSSALPLKDGALIPGRGSLADVLPEPVRQLFVRAASEETATITWSSQSGRSFEWRVCRPPVSRAGSTPSLQPALPAPGGQGDPAAPPVPEALVASAPKQAPHPAVRTSVTEWVRELNPGFRLKISNFRLKAEATSGDNQDAIAGRLVHRLFQFSRNLPACSDEAAESVFARQLLRPEEEASVEDAVRTVRAALNAWRALRARPDVLALMQTGRCHFEVPVSLVWSSAAGSSVLRGTIDCLVERDDGTVVVVEFKTGERRVEDERQLEIYVRAVRALYRDTPVSGQLVYP